MTLVKTSWTASAALLAAIALPLSACDLPTTEQAETTGPEPSSEPAPEPVETASAAPQSVMHFEADLPSLVAPREGAVEQTGEGYELSGIEEDPKSGGSTGGFYVHLPDEFEVAASGNPVTIAVSVRSADGEPLTFGIAYSTRESGNSGWEEFEASDEYQTFSFTYDVPTLVEGRSFNKDAIGINPQIGGGERGLVVRSLTADVLE